MDWRQRLDELKKLGSFRAVDELLTQAVSGAESDQERVEALVAHAELLEDTFLRKVEAANLFTQAVDLDPTRTDALRRARFIHRSLGMLQQVAGSLERELGVTDEAVLAADMLNELGDVMQELGEYDRAKASYANALNLQPGNAAAQGSMDDIDSSESDAQERMMLLAQEGASGTGFAAMSQLVRAARIAKRLGDAGQRAFLEAALRAVPTAVEANAMMDSWFASQGDFEGLKDFHHRFLDTIEDARERGRWATDAAARWLNRFQDSDVAASLLQVAAESDPSTVAPHVALGVYWEQLDDAEEALNRLDTALELANGVAEAAELWLLAEATELAWRKLSDVQRASRYAMLLKQKAPEHPGVEQFLSELEGGAEDEPQLEVVEEESDEPQLEVVEEESDEPQLEVVEEESDEPQLEVVEEEPEPSAAVMEDAPPAPIDIGPSRDLTDEEQAEIAELDAKLEEYEGKKRWSDYIRTLVKKAEIVVDPAQKVELYTEAGTHVHRPLLQPGRGDQVLRSR